VFSGHSWYKVCCTRGTVTPPFSLVNFFSGSLNFFASTIPIPSRRPFLSPELPFGYYPAVSKFLSFRPPRLSEFFFYPPIAINERQEPPHSRFSPVTREPLPLTFRACSLLFHFFFHPSIRVDSSPPYFFMTTQYFNFPLHNCFARLFSAFVYCSAIGRNPPFPTNFSSHPSLSHSVFFFLTGFVELLHLLGKLISPNSPF